MIEKKRNKLLELIAWALACVALCGALLYYNFIDKAIAGGVEVGNVCPDFTVATYTVEDGQFAMKEDSFTLSHQRGKIVVINFWATYCGPCKAELPEFNEIQEKYKEDVTVITLDGEVSFTADRLASWLNVHKDAEGWEKFSILFGRYEEADNNVYTQLGFSSGALPATVIVNREGEIVFKKEGSMHYADLEEVLTPLLKF